MRPTRLQTYETNEIIVTFEALQYRLKADANTP